MLQQLQKYYRTSLIFLCVLVLIVAFQTYQQLFYIERFQLAQDVRFLDILTNQLYRWMIWFAIALILPFLVKKDRGKPKDVYLIAKHFAIIVLLVLLNIFIISLLAANQAENVIIQEFFTEYVTFFLFQKSPLYTLGYIAFTTLLFFHFENQDLSIRVQKMSDLKQQYQQEYEKFKTFNQDETQILSIKIGNSLKVIPIAEIVWIEADDYCVIVHSENRPSYTMRSSLKSLEKELPSNFLRVHRKAIVNMTRVNEFRNGNESKIILSDMTEVAVSKVNNKAVKLYLQQHH
jgi:hypothetical protein